MIKTAPIECFLFDQSDFSIGKNMPEKNLENLIAGIEIVSSVGNRNRQIENIVYDSRKVKSGGLFVAIPGEKHNGETFIKEALNKGAVAIIMQSSSLASLQMDQKNITVLGVDSSRASLAKISANYFGRPSEELNLTGITGTNGKTTLTYILESLSKADGKQAGVIGTIDCHFGETRIPSSMTTPESLDLNQRLRQMVDAGISDCFLEVSSHALTQKRVYDMSFEAGIFTNLSRDHLDFHKNMEEYKNAKAKLFRENTIKTPIVNIDDPAGSELAEELNKNVCTTGIKCSADFSAENIVLNATGSRFTLKTPKGSIEVQTNLLGQHNIYNLISAAAWASVRGMSLETIQNAFQEIPEVPGRFESINCGQNFSVLVDYAHTEDALSKSISAAKTFTKGNVIVVFGCGGDRDKGKREGMGRIALEKADLAIITSDNPRTEDPDQIISDICKGIPDKASYSTITSRREAIGYAIKQAKENDLILIAGKGHEDYQILGEKKERFDDREVAREFLRERAH